MHRIWCEENIKMNLLMKGALNMDLRDKYGVNKNLYKEVICPVCGQVTLDSFWICDNCNWEYDDTIDENEYSDANEHSFRKFRAPLSGKTVHVFPEVSAMSIVN